MLTQPQLQEIKEILEQSQNPLFFFDNDVDGLCSFVILQRALDRGKGVAIKSFPELDETYLRKINELNPDLIVILDKPRVDEKFIGQVLERNLPLLWIDHHHVQVPDEIIKKITYFNSYPTSEPTTYIAQKVFNRQEDLWLAMIGCIGDVYMPEFAQEFAQKNPEIFNSNLTAFDSLYMTEVGKTIKMLNFGLKDTTTNVLQMMKLLQKANSVQDILEENSKTKQLHYRYNQINKEYKKILEKAEAQDKKDKLLFFTYTGPMSMSSEISNELCFKHKNKIIVVAYKKQDYVNISMRGENVAELTEKAIKGFEGASGGGHKNATGARVRIDDFDKFKKKVEKFIEELG